MIIRYQASNKKNMIFQDPSDTSSSADITTSLLSENQRLNQLQDTRESRIISQKSGKYPTKNM